MATITGSDGDDNLNGTDQNDSIEGKEGNDEIEAGRGDDSAQGGAGNDYIDGWEGDDSLDGNEGNDTIWGYDGHDTIDGGQGNDNIRGEDGNDSIDGGDGDDTISGGAGMDTIRGGQGDDRIDGGDRTDVVYGGDGNDYITDSGGSASDDTIYGEKGNDTIAGGEREDYLDGGDDADTFIIEDNFGNDTIVGGEGGFDYDTIDLSALSGPVTITYNGAESGTITDGTHTITFSQIEKLILPNSNDSVDGGSSNDQILAGGGDDTIDGGDGDDWLGGDDGDDHISGGDGQDVAAGGAGNDSISGGEGNDIVTGHEGDDALYGDAGDDSLYGGSGDDYFDGGSGNDQIFMSRNAGQASNTNNTSESDTDVVRLEEGIDHDVAHDFDGTADFIYIGAIPETDIIATQIDANTWVLTIADNNDDSLTLNFASGTEPATESALRDRIVTNDEYTPPQNGQPGSFSAACFTPRARIMTPQGLRPIGALQEGDLVMTADHGPQPVLAVMSTRVSATLLAAKVAFRPVVIEANAWGAGLPLARMHVSRQHAFAACDGAKLIRAAHLADTLGIARIQNNRPNAIRYVHLLLERHELLLVEGVWTESYFAHPDARDIFDGKAQKRLHMTRCRPLLSRADLRHTDIDLSKMGRISGPVYHPAPSTLPAVLTASAPEGVSP